MMEAFIVRKGLTTNGEKLYLIGKLSNVLHTAVKNDVVDIAYLIHEIVNTEDLSMDLRESVAKWQIKYK